MKTEPARKSAELTAEAGTKLPTNSPSFSLKRVLVPVDFSDCSSKALQYALPFAREFGATLVRVQVIEPYLPVPEMGSIDTAMIATQMRDGGIKGLAKIKQSLPTDIAAETALLFGRADWEIVKAASELNIDLIILSTHGHTGLAHVFLGSTTERVVRHAGCPVLVVREREHEFIRPSPTPPKSKPA